MLIGVPRETRPGETRVATTPTHVEQLRGLGYDVLVESGAGLQAGFHDDDYVTAGASIGGRDQACAADVVLGIHAPRQEDVDRLRDGALVISLVGAGRHPELIEMYSRRDITVLATDSVPRISRAQSLDVLSSMSNISGYRAVIEAAEEFDSFFTGQVTAAGKVAPAKVLVVGAGVAGLAAIGAANALGAIVYATDARAEVAEQVESMGATFLPVDVEMQRSTDGYARETSQAFDEAAARLYAKTVPEMDIIITTALIPGRPAPRLITAEMVAGMQRGSVIVDMAAASGGNVEGSVADERIITPQGVRILGHSNLPNRMPLVASRLYATNLVNLLKLITPGKDGQYVLDMDDEVVRGMTIVQRGQVMWPPPPVTVSAAPPPAAAGATAVSAPAATPTAPPSPGRRLGLIAVAALLLLVLSLGMPSAFLGHLTVFALACVIGYYVIGNVHHALHTPLMSVTNAVSGIIVVGAILQAGMAGGNVLVAVLAFLAILLASINIAGGFTVTQRMLTMFRKD
ncbi:Re/Si-specific NAD(P)(+) transhydrogenase subunit alpha [Arsenicicoccus dermatophilus]|uniref:Re/Si-specific NAD(P)(+) transhydrogenase subunit alpha n=1 Tax=Arsenicicoccus dermatophilus TaxID=1076331 RepID=UPI0039173BFC